jgi:hypothetical protein
MFGVKNLGTYGATSFGVGIAALLFTFASGFGPCGPTTAFGGFLVSLGFLASIGGLLTMVGAVLRAAFGRK